MADADKPPEAMPAAPVSSTRFWLEYRAHVFELPVGETVIGRSAGCQLVLDDPLVSRRHAQIVVRPGTATLEDLGSINGAFVNGDPVKGSRRLVPGDRIVIGKQEMVLRAQGAISISADDTHQRFAAETLSGLEMPGIKNRATLLDPLADDVDAESEATHQGQALDLLGGVAEKVLALGRGEEAERILAAYLTNMLETAKRGASNVEPAMHEKAASYAVKLAAATRKGQWVSYCFELYRVLRRPLPGPVIDQLYDVLRNVNDLTLAPLRSYVAMLRSIANQLGPADRFLLHRIEGLERVASAK